MRFLQTALQVLEANTYRPGRERLTAAAGQVQLFNETGATLVNCFANLLASE